MASFLVLEGQDPKCTDRKKKDSRIYIELKFASELFRNIYRHIFRSQNTCYIICLCICGTNDKFVGLHVPTHFQVYRQNSEKVLIAPCPPPPPPPPLSGCVIMVQPATVDISPVYIVAHFRGIWGSPLKGKFSSGT